MSVTIEFDVFAATLAAARRDVELRLAKFLGPDDDPNQWVIAMQCSPEGQSGNGDVVLWRVEVSAISNVA